MFVFIMTWRSLGYHKDMCIYLSSPTFPQGAIPLLLTPGLGRVVDKYCVLEIPFAVLQLVEVTRNYKRLLEVTSDY